MLRKIGPFVLGVILVMSGLAITKIATPNKYGSGDKLIALSSTPPRPGPTITPTPSPSPTPAPTAPPDEPPNPTPSPSPTPTITPMPR